MTLFEKYLRSKTALLVIGALLIVVWLASYFVYHIVGLIQLFFLILFIVVITNFLKAIRKEKLGGKNFEQK